MKKQSRKVLLGAATLAAVMAVGQKDANAATTGVTMTAKIIKAVEITSTTNLKFGSLTQAKTSVTGTVTVDAADNRTAGGGGALSLVGGAGAGQPGGFRIKSAGNVAIAVSGPATAKVTKGGTSTMTVSKFTINSAAKTINSSAFVTTPTKATATGFKLGGTLKSPAVALATGTYTGTVTLTAAYQ